MVRFIEIGSAKVNADRLLLVEPERIINTGEETGCARLLFDNGSETITPLYGQTVNEVLAALLAEGEVT